MARKHFLEQIEYTKSYLLPYFKKHIPNFEKMKVLEVGCAEAGFLHVLHSMKIETVGVELSETRVKIANEENPELKVLVGDITEDKLVDQIGEQFDFVVMREVIEHIPDKESAFKNLNKLTKKDGYLFISFPPKYSGFAGHQQVGRTILRLTPYVHLLPKFMTKFLVKIFNEVPHFLDHIKTNYGTGITIRTFEKLNKKNDFKTYKKSFYLFRPIYKFRFGLPTIPFPNIPFIREFLAFGCEALLKKK